MRFCFLLNKGFMRFEFEYLVVCILFVLFLKDRIGYIDIRVLFLNLIVVKSMLRNWILREKYFNG